MHRKLKNVLSGLAMAAVALVGGAMFGEPAHLHAAKSPAPVIAIELAPDPVAVELPGLWIDVREQGVHVRFVPPVPVTEARPARRRDGAFQMPYFSFGATLPRASSPSES